MFGNFKVRLWIELYKPSKMTTSGAKAKEMNELIVDANVRCKS